MRNYVYSFIFLFLTLVPANSASAQEQQRYSIVLQGATLGDALKEVLQLAPVDIVYSRDLIAGKYVYCRKKDAAFDQILRCVLEGTGIDYIRSSTGTYILMEARSLEPQMGDIGGAVFDADTGAPLPFANVLIADGRAGTTTNEDGLFSLASLVTGRQPMTVSYVGYKPAYDTVYIQAGNVNRHEFYLKADAVNIDPVVINGLVQRMPSSMLGTAEQGKNALQSIQGGRQQMQFRGPANLLV